MISLPDAYDSGITANRVIALPDRGRVLLFPSAGGAKPNAARRYAAVGWVGGVYPSAPIKARTAASDGHCAFTRAARSAGLRFAGILLSKAIDVGRDHLIHRKRSPFPYEGKDIMRRKVGVTANVGRDGQGKQQSPALGLAPHPPLTRSPFPS